MQIKNLNGFMGELRNSIFHYSRKENTEGLNLIYPAGNMIVCSQLTSSFEFDKVQDPIFKLFRKRGITAITQSASKRYIAWAEETPEVPVVIIEDLKTGRRHMVLAEVKSKHFISLCFSGADGQEPKTLIALTGAPEYCLVVFNSVLNDKYRTELCSI